MIFLLLSVFLSSTLFVFFKWLDNRRVRLLSAISGNYISCIITGLLIQGSTDSPPPSLPLLLACIGTGVLFFGTFYAMGYTASRAGIGLSSAAAKLSLIIPILYGGLVLNETLGPLHLLSLFLALAAVFLMSWKPGTSIGSAGLGLSLIVFVGSGITDTVLNLLQSELGGVAPSLAIAIIFSSALCCAFVTMLAGKIRLQNEGRSLGYGMLLGIPNYFSVHCMLLALGSGAFSSGEFYLINNIGVMLLTFLAARLLFSEQITLLKSIGLGLSVLSIYLILYCV